MVARFLALLLVAALVAGAAPAADPPVFSAPTVITHAYAPFHPGSVNIFRGRAEGVPTATLVTHLPATRSFAWGGGTVETCALQEQDFEAGALVEVSTTWIAQDDAGNVRCFGEISWTYQAGVPVEAEEDSWLVGGATQPGDPPGAFAATDPCMYLPSEDQLVPGLSFVAQQLPEEIETLTVMQVDQGVKVPAGKFEGAIRLQELDDGEDGALSSKWLVPNVGLVRDKGKGERGELIASSLP